MDTFVGLDGQYLSAAVRPEWRVPVGDRRRCHERGTSMTVWLAEA